MRPSSVSLCVATLACAASVAAQEGPRVLGPVLLAPPPRAVPPEERRLTAPALGPRDGLGPPRWGLGALAAALVTGFGATVTWLATRPSPQRGRRRGPGGDARVELRRVTVSLAGDGRRAVESALAAVAARVDPATDGGRHALVLAVRDAIVQAGAMVAHGAFQTWSLPAEGGEALTLATGRQRAARAIAGSARPDDPLALATVTLRVIVRGALPPLPARGDAGGLIAALGSMVPPRPDLLLAADLAWAPADPGARFSRAELAAASPELVSVRDPSPVEPCPACGALRPAAAPRCLACEAA